MARDFPFAIKDANIYVEGNEFLGKADITLPQISQKTIEYASLGVAGSVELPLAGHVQVMEGTITFHVIDLETGKTTFHPQKTFMLDCRASYQKYNLKSGAIEEKPLKVTMKVFWKLDQLGTFRPGETGTMEVGFSAVYLKYVDDGNDVLEVDPINYIYSVNGEDLLAETRANLGMS